MSRANYSGCAFAPIEALNKSRGIVTTDSGAPLRGYDSVLSPSEPSLLRANCDNGQQLGRNGGLVIPLLGPPSRQRRAAFASPKQAAAGAFAGQAGPAKFHIDWVGYLLANPPRAQALFLVIYYLSDPVSFTYAEAFANPKDAQGAPSKVQGVPPLPGAAVRFTGDAPKSVERSFKCRRIFNQGRGTRTLPLRSRLLYFFSQL